MSYECVSSRLILRWPYISPFPLPVTPPPRHLHEQVQRAAPSHSPSLLSFNQCRLTPTDFQGADDKWAAIILFMLQPREIQLSGLMSYMTRGKLRRGDLPCISAHQHFGLSLFWWLILSKVPPRWEVRRNCRQIILWRKLLPSPMHINEPAESST